MRRADLKPIALGVAFGVPATIYQNPDYSVAEHAAYILGVVLFCWVAGRFIQAASKTS